MPRPRLELQSLLRQTIGSNKVYFQPSATISMKYPCIVYERSKIDIDHADNKVYKTYNQYTVTAIYTDPDSDLPFKIAKIPTAKHSSHFVYDNLYHDVYTIYF